MLSILQSGLRHLPTAWVARLPRQVLPDTLRAQRDGGAAGGEYGVEFANPLVQQQQQQQQRRTIVIDEEDQMGMSSEL